MFTEFPALKESSSFRITSPPSDEYNCIAWSAEDMENWWWPDSMFVCYWPPALPREESIAAFVAAYRTLGYVECDSPDLEADYQKIALYARGDKPKHAARQLPTGKWSSKLGRSEDIQHDLSDLEGGIYGEVVRIFSRRN